MTSELQTIRKEYKAFGKTEMMYDVYCDRVNFVACTSFFPLSVYCDNRGIIYDRDRGGYSIDLKDAQKMGLPMEPGKSTYIINTKDLRKKPIKSAR